MNNIFVSIALCFMWAHGFAQESVLNYVSSPYISKDNRLTSLSTLQDYLEDWSIDRSYPFDASDPFEYYKVSYQFDDSGSTMNGVLDIGYGGFTGSIASDFAQEFNAYFEMMIVDDDPGDYVKEIVSTSTVDGGYMFHESEKIVRFYVNSKPRKGRVMGSVIFNTITESELKAFAKDFIQKMKFK